jgi:hypothetical protein
MPAFNIHKFKANLTDLGTIQTNKFLVKINPWKLSDNKSVNSTSTEALMFRAESIKMPGINLETLSTNRYGIGTSQKFPTNVLYNDIDITFLETRDLLIYTMFDEWINAGIFNHSRLLADDYVDSLRPNYALEYKEKYSTYIIIEVYNNEGTELPHNESTIKDSKREVTPTSQIVLLDAYPISINDNSLNWSDNNNLLKLSVRFNFKQYYITSKIESRFKTISRNLF